MEDIKVKFELRNISENYIAGFGNSLMELKAYVKHVQAITNDNYKIVDRKTGKDVYYYPDEGSFENA